MYTYLPVDYIISHYTHTSESEPPFFFFFFFGGSCLGQLEWTFKWKGEEKRMTKRVVLRVTELPQLLFPVVQGLVTETAA